MDAARENRAEGQAWWASMARMFEGGYVPCDEPPGLEERAYARWKEEGGRVLRDTYAVETLLGLTASLMTGIHAILGKVDSPDRIMMLARAHHHVLACSAELLTYHNSITEDALEREEKAKQQAPAAGAGNQGSPDERQV